MTRAVRSGVVIGYGGAVTNRPTTRFSRVASILAALSLHEPVGLRLSDLVNEVRMPKTTVYRLVEELVQVGFASYDGERQAYHLGDSIDVLARRGSARFDLRRRMLPFLEKLVEELCDTVYFMQVRGDRLVCAERLVGDYPIQSISLDIGAVRPMGVGSSGAAVASCLSQQGFERLLVEQAAERGLLSIDDAAMRSIVDQTRTDGVSFNPATIVPDMSGMGVPILNGEGLPVAAVSVVAINQRFSDGRRSYIASRLNALREEAERELRHVL